MGGSAGGGCEGIIDNPFPEAAEKTSPKRHQLSQEKQNFGPFLSLSWDLAYLMPPQYNWELGGLCCRGRGGGAHWNLLAKWCVRVFLTGWNKPISLQAACAALPVEGLRVPAAGCSCLRIGQSRSRAVLPGIFLRRAAFKE